MPNIHINYVAILIAVAAHFVLGFIWYTPLFGKVWAKELGLKMDQKPPTAILLRGMLFNLIGNFFLAFVLSHNMAAWNPLSWGQAPSDMSPAQNAFMAAIFTWLGFFFPVDINAVAWEGKSWKLFFINTGYHLVSVMLVAMIIAHMQ